MGSPSLTDTWASGASQGDTRYGSAGTITTHDQADMPAHPVLRLEEVDNAAWHHDVIAIDEGQFLPGAAILIARNLRRSVH